MQKQAGACASSPPSKGEGGDDAHGCLDEVNVLEHRAHPRRAARRRPGLASLQLAGEASSRRPPGPTCTSAD